MSSSKRNDALPGKGQRSFFKAFLTKLKKRRIIETLAAFIAGGWLILEFVDRLLVAHYHIHEKWIDVAFFTLLGALICVIFWRWFRSEEKRQARIKVEVLLVPLIVLATLTIDLNLIFHITGVSGKKLLIEIIALCLGIAWIVFKSLQWAARISESGKKEVEVSKSSALKPEKSIVVLPFVDLSPQKDQEYFCDGMSEELINLLSQIKDLHVVARTSAFSFKDKKLDIREIGKKLNVETALEGSVRKADNRLRITAQLINVSDGYHLWGEQFDRELRNVFEIQEEIARNIVHELQVSLSPQERGVLQKAPTHLVQAYDFYLRGRSFYYQYGKRDIEFALQLFSRATELDPGYALAYAGLADCWSYIYLYSDRKESARQKAESASRRAIELAPDSAQAQASHALAMSIGGHVEEAERGFEAAIRLDPKLFEAWYFYARHAFGRGDLKAARLFEEASRVRPDDFQSPLLVAQIYDDLGRPEEARASRRRGVALAEERIELHPDDARALYMGANGLVALGERERGLEWARRARDIAPEEPMILYNLGCIYSLAGEIDEALDCLERSVALGLTQKGWYEHDSNLDPLRQQPRFKALMDRLKS
jgi:TolB-like protein